MDIILAFTYFLKSLYDWRGLKQGMQDGETDSCAHISFVFKAYFTALDFFLPR